MTDVTRTYASTRLRQILLSADGSRIAARHLLSKAVREDDRLLRAIVDPFLPAIIGHFVERSMAGTPDKDNRRSPRSSGLRTADDEPAKGRADRPAPALSAEALDKLVGALGQKTGPERTATTSNPSGHARTMQILAAAYRTKRRG